MSDEANVTRDEMMLASLKDYYLKLVDVIAIAERQAKMMVTGEVDDIMDLKEQLKNAQKEKVMARNLCHALTIPKQRIEFTERLAAEGILFRELEHSRELDELKHRAKTRLV